MKIIAIISFITLLAGTGAFAQERTITLDMKDVPLADVVAALKKLGYFFTYSPDDLNDLDKVTIVVTNAPLKEVLDICFKNKPLSYEIRSVYYVILIRIPKSPVETPGIKPPTVSGIVYNKSGELLEGVTVSEQGTQKYTLTKSKGRFEISITGNAATLVFSYVGYEIQKKIVENGGNITVEMNDKPADLDEVVVVIPYGILPAKLLTGGVAKITSQDISRQTISHPLASVMNSVPGVIVTQANGLPAARLGLQIRGQNSIGIIPGIFPADDPLYQINGIPYPPNYQFKPAGGFGSASQDRTPLSAVNPEDVESIEIFKDADATAIYGSRAANGVVNITTKKGKSGKPVYNFNLRTATSWIIRKVHLLNTPQYVMMRKEALKNDNLPVNNIFAPDLVSFDTSRYTDLQGLFIGGPASTTNIQGGVSGGTDNTQYLLSASHDRETTVFTGNLSYNRTTFHAQVNHHSRNNKLTLCFAALYSSERDNSIAIDQTGSITAAPNIPAFYDASGALNWQANNTVFDNPMAFAQKKDLVKTNNVLLSMQLNYRIFPHWMLKINAGYTGVALDEINTEPGASLNPFVVPNPMGSSYFATITNKSWIIEPQVEYWGTLKGGKLTVLFGSTWQDSRNNLKEIIATGFANDNLLTNISAAGSLKTLNDEKTQYRYYGMFTRISYNLKDQYLLNITARTDGSSRFGANRKFGNFGAVGAGWIFSNAPFINKHFGILSFGKLRSSYGITGNDQIGEYQYLAYWSRATLTYLGNNGLLPTQLANPNYSWEVCRKFEAAVDLGFFKDRLSLSVAWYRNLTGNQLLSYAIPATTGFTNIAVKNFDAIVENTGFEITAQAKIIDKKTLTFTSKLILTIPRNVLRSFPDLNTSRYSRAFIVGQSLTAQRTLHYTGVDPASGLFQFEDHDKDSNLTYPNDYTSIKNTDPKCYGNLENNITFKNWELDISIQGRIQNGYSYLYSIYSSAPPGTQMINQPVAVLNRWQQPGDHAPVQRFSAGADASATDAISNFLQSDGKFTDVSYLRLRNISLRYNFKEQLLRKISAKKASIYLLCQNLFTITAYEGFYPETQMLYTLPPLKTIMIGIDIGF